MQLSKCDDENQVGQPVAELNRCVRLLGKYSSIEVRLSIRFVI